MRTQTAIPLGRHTGVHGALGDRPTGGVLTVICAWCGLVLGEKDAEGTSPGLSHSVCEQCADELKAASHSNPVRSVGP